MEQSLFMGLLDYLKRLLESWGNSTLDFLPRIILATVILFLFFVLGKIAKKASLRVYSRAFKSNTDIAKIIASVVYFAFLLFGVFLVLEILGLEQVLTKLLAGAGIIGIVAGFAFKDIASNVFSGLLLNVQQPFKVGDWVSMEGAYGTVVKISWLTTTVQNTTGQEVYVPNQIIYTNIFTNYTSLTKRRITIQCSIPADSNLEHVKAVALDETSKSQYLLNTESVDFYFTDIVCASSVPTFKFEVSFWTRFSTESDYQKAMSDAIINIKKRFEEEKIKLA